MIQTSRVSIKVWGSLILFSCFFSFLLLEGIVRVVKLAPPITQFRNSVADPYLPFKPQPFSLDHVRTHEFEYEVRHNSLGFRDVEHTFEKPQGVFRILGLGDSFTYGVGVPFEETYLCRLEKMFNERVGNHSRVEIIKAGIYRYWPEPERLLLEHYGISFHPDLILVGFLPNDVIETFQGMDDLTVSKSGYLIHGEFKELSSLGTWLYLHCHIYRLILERYVKGHNRSKDPILWNQIFRADGYYEKDWKKIESEFKKMIDLAHQVGAQIVFVHIPEKGPWKEYYSYLVLRLVKFCELQHVEFVDILPAMKEVSQREVLYWKKDTHCNSAGYRVIAETLFSRLTEKKLVP